MPPLPSKQVTPQNINDSQVGLGDQNATLKVYIANRPPLDEYRQLNSLRAIFDLEIQQIAEQTGNHWRKIFNCYAKLCYGLNPQSETSWQAFRDHRLLRADSPYSLLFSAPALSSTDHITIICGKTYFHQLALGIDIEWLDDSFAINRTHKLIVSPYFDYRQLSNQKIEQLISLIQSLT